MWDINKTAHFRIVCKPDNILANWYYIQKRNWWYQWRYMKRLTSNNKGLLSFLTEKEALDYISKTNYKTKVLWSDVPHAK